MLAGETGVDIHHEEVYQEEQGRHYKKQDLHFKQVVVGDQKEEVLLAEEEEEETDQQNFAEFATIQGVQRFVQCPSVLHHLRVQQADHCGQDGPKGHLGCRTAGPSCPLLLQMMTSFLQCFSSASRR